ncbi:sigma-70 family RNA polymerase sigma factor [Streptomyces sp. KL2]|uniref:sigma-70 family RNA polymerase sigma factor n=1 Tax=Streptomyces sp. KL2 TaxID=3050126 RepID=UPI003979B546
MINDLDSELREADTEGPGSGVSITAWGAGTNRDQMEADRELYRRLRAAEFTGWLRKHLEQDLWQYGWRVLRAWMRDGSVMNRCAEKGIRMSSRSEEEQILMRSDDVRDEIAFEAVKPAVEYFINDVLAEGKWDPRRGATLRTYFMGTCLHYFRDAFKTWARSHRRRLKEVSGSLDLVDRPSREVHPEELAALRDTVRRVLSGASWEVRAICALIYESGLTQKEIGEKLGMTSRVVEVHLRKLRKQAKLRVRLGHVSVPYYPKTVARASLR